MGPSGHELGYIELRKLGLYTVHCVYLCIIEEALNNTRLLYLKPEER